MKVACPQCRWHGEDTEQLSAPNPFVEGDTIYACPKCREIGIVFRACGEPECWREATCGTPVRHGVSEGYRWTCGKHQPEMIHSHEP